MKKLDEEEKSVCKEIRERIEFLRELIKASEDPVKIKIMNCLSFSDTAKTFDRIIAETGIFDSTLFVEIHKLWKLGLIYEVAQTTPMWYGRTELWKILQTLARQVADSKIE